MPEILVNANETKVRLCQKKRVMTAISALKSLNEKVVEKELKKKPLLDETSESPVYLQLMLKKIPPSKLLQMIKFHLPHSLINETSEVCLITGDLDKHNHKAEIEPVVMHYKDLLKKHGVTVVNEVIPLRQLRTEYKTFESKRQLMAAYNVFLVDKKIAGVMPKVLGKSFFRKRRFPIQVNMKTSNLKSHIENALSQTEFSLSCRGNSYAFEVARLSMESSAILENVMSTVKVLADKIPGRWDNVLGIYLRTAKSKAIPIYISFGNPNDVTLKKLRKKEKAKFQELSTINDAQVKILRDGRIILQRKRESKSVDDGEATEDINVENDIASLTDEDLQVVSENSEDPDVNNASLEVKSEMHLAVAESSNDKKTPLKHRKRKSFASKNTGDNEANKVETGKYVGTINKTPLKIRKSKILKNEGIDEMEAISKSKKNKVVQNDEFLDDDSLTTPLKSKRNKDIKKATMESSTKSKRKNTHLKNEDNKEKQFHTKKGQTPKKLSN